MRRRIHVCVLTVAVLSGMRLLAVTADRDLVLALTVIVVICGIAGTKSFLQLVGGCRDEIRPYFRA